MDAFIQRTARVERINKLVKTLSDSQQLDLIKQLETAQQEKRESSRKRFFSEISFAGDKGAQHDFTRDISGSGLFIETQVKGKVGERVSLAFSGAKGSKPIKLSGEISRNAPNGIGIKFHPFGRETEKILQALLDNLK